VDEFFGCEMVGWKKTFFFSLNKRNVSEYSIFFSCADFTKFFVKMISRKKSHFGVFSLLFC